MLMLNNIRQTANTSAHNRHSNTHGFDEHVSKCLMLGKQDKETCSSYKRWATGIMPKKETDLDKDK